MAPLLTALGALLVAWFAAGSAMNVRRGSAALRWLRGGLSRLGERAIARRRGTRAVELVVNEPRAPFQEATVLVSLAPRDLPWWPLGLAAGRRDTLILRGVFRAVPNLELEILDPRSWSGREALRRLLAAEWSVREPAPAGNLLTLCTSRPALARAAELLQPAARAGAVRRLSVRATAPHLELHVDLPGPDATAGQVLEAVRELAELVSRARPR